MSTAQVESVLVEHKSVAESAVVSAPHKIKGECLYCFVTPKDGCRVSTKLFVAGNLREAKVVIVANFPYSNYILITLFRSMNKLWQN